MSNPIPPAQQRPYPKSAITLSGTLAAAGRLQFPPGAASVEQLLFHHQRPARRVRSAIIRTGPAPASRRAHGAAHPPGWPRLFPSLRRLSSGWTRRQHRQPLHRARPDLGHAAPNGGADRGHCQRRQGLLAAPGGPHRTAGPDAQPQPPQVFRAAGCGIDLGVSASTI